MTENIGLLELFTARPELLDALKELIETTHNFLHNARGGNDDHIEAMSGCTSEILAAARTTPALRAWAERLDDFEAREQLKCEGAG